MNEQKKILFYEEGFFDKSVKEYDPILSSYLEEEKKRQQNLVIYQIQIQSILHFPG